jgi:hypothetical protein
MSWKKVASFFEPGCSSLQCGLEVGRGCDLGSLWDDDCLQEVEVEVLTRAVAGIAFEPVERELDQRSVERIGAAIWGVQMLGLSAGERCGPEEAQTNISHFFREAWEGLGAFLGHAESWVSCRNLLRGWRWQCR